MINRRLSIALVVLTVTAVIVIVVTKTVAIGEAQPTLPTRELVINSRRLVVEIADEPEEQRRGLSYRESLGRDRGMLFVFPEATRQRFWMRGMRFPLDLVFINGDQVVHIAENVPPPSKGGIPVVVLPTEAADKVLELNAGMAAALGLVVGYAIAI